MIHPLAIGTKVQAQKPNCPCKGGGMITITGEIKKVIDNKTNFWYYLHTGHTISDQWVIKTIG